LGDLLMADNPLQAQQDSIRIPVYDVEGFRTDWPLYDQNLVNCFAEVVRNPVSGSGEIVATKRPGLQVVSPETLDFTSLTADPSKFFPIANYCVTNVYDVYICAYNDADAGLIRIITYRPQVPSFAQVATIPSTSTWDKVYFSHGWVDTSDNPTWVVTCTWEDGTGASTKGFAVELSGGVISAGTWSQITHVNSPWGQTPAKQTRGPLIQLNNQWYVASLNGQIHSTGTTSPTSSYVSNADTVTAGPNYQGWSNAANFIASRFPESYVGLIQYKHHLVALGLTSMQFFTDEGESINPGIPILPTDQALIKFGCISGKHCINVDDILYWIAYGKDNTVGLWKIEGYTPVKISNKKQDNEIRTMAQSFTELKASHLFTIILGNKKHIGISNSTTYTLGYAGNNSDFPQSDTYVMGIFDCYARMSMYSIEDKTWWYITSTGGIGNVFAGMYPVTSFGTSISPKYDLGSYKQYILMRLAGTISSAMIQGAFIWTTVEGTYLDSYLDSAWKTYAVCTTIQFNGIQVSTEKRKRINRVKSILGSNFKKNSADTTVNKYCLLVSKKNVIDDNLGVNTDTIIRTIDIPNNFYRYYWNNLGMGRNISLALMERTNQPHSVRYLEIDLAQGTS
jgi:hypothetical protein